LMRSAQHTSSILFFPVLITRPKVFLFSDFDTEKAAFVIVGEWRTHFPCPVTNAAYDVAQCLLIS
ncbi:MAG: hypothetical protein MR564_01890, partial [Paraprevotella sp.]|nr:hypothetical protein [Paraprevotella sp.]